MCWTMCTLSSVVSYAARPEEVATKKMPIPTPTNASVRPIGQWSPRRRRTTTPTTYSPTTHTVTHEQERVDPHSVKTLDERERGRSRNGQRHVENLMSPKHGGRGALRARSGHNGVRGDRNGYSRIPSARASRPSEHGQRGHHHLALERVDVLRGAVRLLLHDPRGQRGDLGDRTPPCSTCRSLRSTPRSWCCPP